MPYDQEGFLSRSVIEAVDDTVMHGPHRREAVGRPLRVEGLGPVRGEPPVGQTEHLDW